jgi:hypothetical protein
MAKKKSKPQRLSTNPFDAYVVAKPKRANKPKNVFYANVSPAPQVGKGRKKNRPKRTRGGASGITVNHVRGVCSITDPFCPAAKNSKWPDGTQGNTMTEQFRGSVVLNSGANSVEALALAAAAPFGYVKSASSTSTAVTMAATSTVYKANSMLATYGDEYRIVSFGAIIRCIAAASSAGGYVTLGTVGKLNASQVITLGGELYDEVIIKAIQPGMELSWVSQPRGPTAREFRAQSTNALPAVDWTNLIIEVVGVSANTPVLSVEWYLNVEFTCAPYSVLAASAHNNPPKSAPAESAVSNVHTTLGSFVEGGVRSVEMAVASAANDALNTLIKDPMGSLTSLFAMM